MKKALFLFCIMLLAYGTARAAGPYTICDVQTGVDFYTVTTDTTIDIVPVLVGYTRVVTDALGTREKLYLTDPGTPRTLVHVLKDNAALSIGSHTQKAKACIYATIWNPEVCSADSVPLVFVRPGSGVAPNIPTNIRNIGL